MQYVTNAQLRKTIVDKMLETSIWRTYRCLAAVSVLLEEEEFPIVSLPLLLPQASERSVFENSSAAISHNSSCALRHVIFVEADSVSALPDTEGRWALDARTTPPSSVW